MTDPSPTVAENLPSASITTSPLEAVPEIRSTIKWIAASAAAVGALLVGSAPLATLGRLHGIRQVSIAGVGLLLCLVAVGWIIWQTTEALTPPITTFSTLEDKSLTSLRIIIAADPEAYFGPFGRTLEAFRTQGAFHRKTMRNIQAKVRSERDQSRLTIWKFAESDALATVELHRTLQTRLLELAHFWQVREKLRYARRQMFMAMILGAAGLGLILSSGAIQAKVK